jgi:hypothetical protein
LCSRDSYGRRVLQTEPARSSHTGGAGCPWLAALHSQAGGEGADSKDGCPKLGHPSCVTARTRSTPPGLRVPLGLRRPRASFQVGVDRLLRHYTGAYDAHWTFLATAFNLHVRQQILSTVRYRSQLDATLPGGETLTSMATELDSCIKNGGKPPPGSSAAQMEKRYTAIGAHVPGSPFAKQAQAGSQLPAIGGTSVYAGAAMLAGLPSDSPEETWKRLVDDVTRKHGGALKRVSASIRLPCPRDSVASEFAATGARLHEAVQSRRVDSAPRLHAVQGAHRADAG